MDTKLFHLFLAVICTCLRTVSTNECTFTEKCSCFQSNEYEYQCPPDDFEINIRALPDQYVKMYCENMTSFDLNKFPDIDVASADYFSMSYCPLPNMSFSEILNKLRMLHPKTLVFEANNLDKITFTKGVLEGLSELESLTIRYSSLSTERDFLASTPKLVKLILPNNNIIAIDFTFNYTSQIKYLDLSRNKIEGLPNGVFYNLHKLQKLHLWRNNLTILNKQMFSGLDNLMLLELSINAISDMSEDVFSELKQLVNISLKNNELGYVARGLFHSNIALESVRIGSNPKLQLSDYLLANLTSLKHVNIDESNLVEIPEHLFEGSFNLEDISLSKNKLRSLPENLFKNLKALTKITLSYNELRYLHDNTFDTLSNLTELFLQNNFIESLNNNIFKKLSSLLYLNLERNKISIIENKAFNSLTKLRVINLKHNRWNYSLPKRGGEKLSALLASYYSPFNACQDVEEINLESNFITEMPQDLLYSKTKMKKLNLASNLIDTIRMTDFVGVQDYTVVVDLSKNNLSLIEFSQADYVIGKNSGSTNNEKVQIILDDNTIHCDCFLYDLVRFNTRMMSPTIYEKFEISQKNFNCTNFEQAPVTQIKPISLSCAVESNMGCPVRCECQWKPYDRSVIIDCSYKNLTTAPVISSSAFDGNYLKYGFAYNQTVVNLEGNKLSTGPKDGMGYHNVTRLSLVGNELSNLTWIPPRVQVLQLDNNNIEMLEEDIISVLENSTSLKKLSISSNPWKCDCSASSLQNFLMHYYKQVDGTDVVCLESGELLVNVTDLCQVPTGVIVAVTVILFFVLVIVTMLALYYRFEREIKIYLYAKNLFLWFVSEEDLDKDKTYDVFICYQNKDEHFVVKDLLPVLEKGPNPYKTCVHVRDFIPGELITTQVFNSIQDSKRTMIILSNNFVESEWCLMEFRTAHGQAMRDGRARVLVVIYGDLNEDLLDKDVKAYFKTNTYVKWGDPWFWEKIRYAMPHSKRPNYNNKKHANVMLKIDEKYEFANSPSTPNHTSTPPLSLDPSLLKNNKNGFGAFENNTTLIVPDGEAPLLNR